MAEPDDAALDAYVATLATTLQLEIAADWQPIVRANVATLLEVGRFVAAFELPDDVEPAPVFEA